METLAAEIVDGEAPGYRYLDDKMEIIWTTSVPKDDEAAIGYFHSIMLFGRQFCPVYVQKRVKREGRYSYDMLPVKFDPETMSTERIKKAAST